MAAAVSGIKQKLQQVCGVRSSSQIRTSLGATTVLPNAVFGKRANLDLHELEAGTPSGKTSPGPLHQGFAMHRHAMHRHPGLVIQKD